MAQSGRSTDAAAESHDHSGLKEEPLARGDGASSDGLEWSDHSGASEAVTHVTTKAMDDEEDRVYWGKMRAAKRDARSEIRLDQWDQYQFCKLNLDRELGPPLNNIEYIHCDDFSPAEFAERFEATCKPVVIRGLMDRSLYCRGFFLCTHQILVVVHALVL